MWLGPARHRPFNPNRFHYKISVISGIMPAD
ncbi:MAG: hypothetical protein R2758_02300 [Bacteroidales bacterium]